MPTCRRRATATAPRAPRAARPPTTATTRLPVSSPIRHRAIPATRRAPPSCRPRRFPTLRTRPARSRTTSRRRATTSTTGAPGPRCCPVTYGNFHLTGGSASCAFLDGGVYTWTNGYSSDASGSLLSNELKAPDEQSYAAPGTTAVANPQFWDQNGTGCAGAFNLSVVTVGAGQGIKHQGGAGNWGVELTSVRYDQFVDPTVSPNPCFAAPGCRRESAPSACKQISTNDSQPPGIDVNVTRNAPGAQYYDVYVNPNGCDGNTANFSFVGRFLAPGFTDGGAPPAAAVGPYPSGANKTLVGGQLGWPCPAAAVSICNLAYNSLTPTVPCFALSRAKLCQAPDSELAPQCFSGCPPPAGTLSQENAPMKLQYMPDTGGDVANENYCVPSANPGDANAPCAGARVTPGAVQFYMPAGSCMSQNAQGATYVFSGEQYNWIVIYQPPANTCCELDERRVVDTVHRDDLHPRRRLDHQRRQPSPACRPGHRLHGDRVRRSQRRHRLQPQLRTRPTGRATHQLSRAAEAAGQPSMKVVAVSWMRPGELVLR